MDIKHDAPSFILNKDNIANINSIEELNIGGQWNSILGLYGIDIRKYFIVDEVNKINGFRLDDFKTKMSEIENEKKWCMKHIYNKICEIKKVDSLKEFNVIEIGSGTGIMAEWLSNKVNHVTCVDIDLELIDYCKKYHKDIKNISHYGIENSLDFSMFNNIDLVYAQSVFIHLGVINFYVYLKELRKILNTGALIYLDIIDSDLDNFNFDYIELKRQADTLSQGGYSFGEKYLFTVNSTKCLAKVATELGFELISNEVISDTEPNSQLIFKKILNI